MGEEEKGPAACGDREYYVSQTRAHKELRRKDGKKHERHKEADAELTGDRAGWRQRSPGQGPWGQWVGLRVLCLGSGLLSPD